MLNIFISIPLGRDIISLSVKRNKFQRKYLLKTASAKNKEMSGPEDGARTEAEPEFTAAQQEFIERKQVYVSDHINSKINCY